MLGGLRTAETVLADVRTTGAMRGDVRTATTCAKNSNRTNSSAPAKRSTKNQQSHVTLMGGLPKPASRSSSFWQSESTSPVHLVQIRIASR
jgi:hypothetical protein